MSEDIVYIIEAPGPKELFIENLEGKSLSTALTACRIHNEYFLCINRRMFLKALFEVRNMIRAQFASATTKPPGLYYLHISCHGNEEGLGLSNSEFVSWQQFRRYLDIINTDPKVGYHMSNNITCSPISLCLSACYGHSASQLNFGAGLAPYVVLVAPIDPITFSESLVAFITFYHLMCNKDLKGDEAVERMNAAAMPNTLLNIDLGKEFRQLIESKQKEPVA